MSDLHQKTQEAINYINSHFKNDATVAIITGTGIEIEMKVLARIPYDDIPNFVASTVQSHKGEILYGTIQGKKIVVLAGRMHYYEGYSAKEITFPVRVLKALGISRLLITNVSGGLNPDYNAGDIVMLRDHIFLQPDHPLRGANDDRLGPRFPDMMHTYDTRLLAAAKTSCLTQNIPHHTGVYACLQGPSLETPAEYNYLHIIGADMVGMSTIPEVIVARHAGISVAVASIISNVCYPIDNLSPTTIEAVIEVAGKAMPHLNKLISDLVTTD